MYKPVRLDARDRAVRLGVQGKVEQWLGGAERLGGSERRLGRAGEAAELCGVAELLGAQGKAEQRLGGAAELCGAAEILGVPLTSTAVNTNFRSQKPVCFGAIRNDEVYF